MVRQSRGVFAQGHLRRGGQGFGLKMNEQFHTEAPQTPPTDSQLDTSQIFQGTGTNKQQRQEEASRRKQVTQPLSRATSKL